ncbi:hemerythrin domain-containing protein [Leptolyngbya sp. FACHB-261]|uniref:hemerythrin domain-containing protein n=1 Tax=Leptolyngbya sp. FACHB-261 TaxID=2692806 RepID=UPI001683859E|nr:hemerythrin domain-containing protein [Leptolyngbya sp. FACHB-261]MBD2102920.1 hemerythrin domain-containing protein [Leptolyngbya sp. FACHB-261]
MDVLDNLHADHQQAATLFEQLKQTDDPQIAQAYFHQLYEGLTAHSAAEEGLFYPSVRNSDTESLVAAFYQEHLAIRQFLQELKALGSTAPKFVAPEFKAKLSQLQQTVENHVQREENELFPKVRQYISQQQLEQMAAQVESAEAQVQDMITDPHSL